MKAFVKTGHQPGDAGVRDVSVVKPGPGEVLLGVASCGVCGSDVHAFRSDPGFEWVTTPVTLGHEFSGIVEEVGPGVTRVSPGDRVVAVAVQGCGRCETCLSGSTQLCPGSRGHRPLPRWGDGRVRRDARGAPRSRSRRPRPRSGGPGRAAVRSRTRGDVRAEIEPGQRVVVSGPGPIGILCGMLARLQGGGSAPHRSRARFRVTPPGSGARGAQDREPERASPWKIICGIALGTMLPTSGSRVPDR